MIEKDGVITLRECCTCSTCRHNHGGRCARNNGMIRWRQDRCGWGDYVAGSDADDEGCA